MAKEIQMTASKSQWWLIHELNYMVI